MKIKIEIGLILTLVFGCLVAHAIGQTHKQRHVRATRLYTNDDLAKYSEKFDTSLASDSLSDNGEQSQAPSDKAAESPDRQAGENDGDNDRAEQLKIADHNLEKAKSEEARLAMSLVEFQKKVAEAQTAFQKQTAEWQAEDTEKNLARAREVRHRAEMARSKALQAVSEAGLKPGSPAPRLPR